MERPSGPRFVRFGTVGEVLPWLFRAEAALAVGGLGIDALDEHDGIDRAGGVVAIAALLLFVVIGVLFATWLWRVAWNTRELDRLQRHLDPGWAVGGWFVPVANAVIPLQIVRRSWRATTRTSDGDDPRLPWPVVGWWLLFLCALTRLWLPIGPDAVIVVCAAGSAALAPAMMRAIAGPQEAAISRRQVALAAGATPAGLGPRARAHLANALELVGGGLGTVIGALAALVTLVAWSGGLWAASESGGPVDIGSSGYLVALLLAAVVTVASAALLVHAVAVRLRRR